MFNHIENNKYEYTIMDEDIEYVKSFMAFTAMITKNRKQYAPVKNLTWEYMAIEAFIVDKFINQHDVRAGILITVKGKYNMEIYIKDSKELGGITHSAKIL